MRMSYTEMKWPHIYAGSKGQDARPEASYQGAQDASACTSGPEYQNQSDKIAHAQKIKMLVLWTYPPTYIQR